VLHLSHTYRFYRPLGPRGQKDKKWIVLTAMAISSGVTSIPTSAVVLAIPEIHEEFNASIGELQWTIVGFSLAYSALLVIAGRLADVYGRKKFFLGGTIVYAAGALGAAVSPNAIVLIVAVVIMGVGAAVLTPASLSIITNAFAPEQRGTAIGIWAAASALVSGVGPALGGVLAGWEWRSVFWINIPFAVIFFVMTMLAARESRDPHANRHVDTVGLGTLAGGLTALSLVLNEGQTWGFTSTKSIILFVAAGLLLVLFFVFEPRARNPLVDFGFFRKRNYLGGNSALLVAGFALAAILFFLPMYMQEVLGYSPVKAGVLLLPLSATMVIALPIGGPISERIGPRIPIVAGLGLTALGCYLLTRINADSGFDELWPGMLVAGAGAGLALTPLNTAAMNAIRRAEHGAAAGILVTMGGIGATFGVALSGSFFQTVKDHKSDELLSKLNIGLTESQERTLDGLLAGSPEATAELHKFPPGQQVAIKHALRHGFTEGLSTVMWLSLGITVAGMILVALVMQRSAPIPDEEELEAIEAAEVTA
jgi:EmrB/QacA subfamily drug resistance transporter